MLHDLQNTVSDDQDLAVAASTVLSDKSIDLGAAATDSLGNTVPSDIGRGVPVEILVQVTETFTSGGAGTLQAKLVMADNAALDSNLVILHSSETIALGTLVAGSQFRISGGLPPGISKRYLGVQYVVATATMTAGKVTATLLKDRQTTTV